MKDDMELINTGIICSKCSSLDIIVRVKTDEIQWPMNILPRNLQCKNCDFYIEHPAEKDYSTERRRMALIRFYRYIYNNNDMRVSLNYQILKKTTDQEKIDTLHREIEEIEKENSKLKRSLQVLHAGKHVLNDYCSILLNSQEDIEAYQRELSQKEKKIE